MKNRREEKEGEHEPGALPWASGSTDVPKWRKLKLMSSKPRPIEHNRLAAHRLTTAATSPRARITVLTGARQTGKTTLVRRALPDLAYISFDDPVTRAAWTRLSAADWVARYPHAALDEVQKAPGVIDTIKAAHDADPTVRYVLLGSSQILLLDKVRESLAGRVALEEMWPLTLPERLTDGWDDPVRPSRLLRQLHQLVERGVADEAPLRGMPLTDKGFALARAAWATYLAWGGMPALADVRWSDTDRWEWLVDYRRTYLERDVADLAALRDLEPFIRAQECVALRTGQLLETADLARAAKVAGPTAARFVRYLELSYQVLTLPPWFRNQEKRLQKRPKVHVVDPGILRSLTGRRGPLTGPEYESAVVAEVCKQLRSQRLPWRPYHLRTHDGREVDLLLEGEHGFVAMEIKASDRVDGPDARHLTDLETLLDRPLLARWVVSEDPDLRELKPGVVAVPAPWLLGPA